MMDVAAIEPAVILGTVGSNLAVEKIPSGDLCAFSFPILDELQGVSLYKVHFLIPLYDFRGVGDD